MDNTNNYDFYCEEVLSGKTQIEKLYESESVLAYYHTRPFWETHIVIIPKKHIHDLTRLTEEDLPTMQEIIKVAGELAKNLHLSKGVKLLTNLGKFQDTPHLHFHLAEGEEIR